MNGHGVGMSLSGAICMANSGQTMNDIITYFYTGVAVEKIWK
jgi:SpoIID/LytB domain protein